MFTHHQAYSVGGLLPILLEPARLPAMLPLRPPDPNARARAAARCSPTRLLNDAGPATPTLSAAVPLLPLLLPRCLRLFPRQFDARQACAKRPQRKPAVLPAAHAKRRRRV